MLGRRDCGRLASAAIPRLQPITEDFTIRSRRISFINPNSPQSENWKVSWRPGAPTKFRSADRARMSGGDCPKACVIRMTWRDIARLSYILHRFCCGVCSRNPSIYPDNTINLLYLGRQRQVDLFRLAPILALRTRSISVRRTWSTTSPSYKVIIFWNWIPFKPPAPFCFLQTVRQ